jgi:hypothetical protein
LAALPRQAMAQSKTLEVKPERRDVMGFDAIPASQETTCNSRMLLCISPFFSENLSLRLLRQAAGWN